MTSVKFFADICASWIHGLLNAWNYITTTPANDYIKQALEISQDPLADALLGAVQLIVNRVVGADGTILEFFLGCMGVGFGVYFFVVMISWFIGIVT